jgi:hypothetical protein
LKAPPNGNGQQTEVLEYQWRYRTSKQSLNAWEQNPEHHYDEYDCSSLR